MQSQVQILSPRLSVKYCMKECEFCAKEHDGSYASGRFCSVSCSRRMAQSKVSKDGAVKRDEALRKASREGKANRKGTSGYRWSEEAKASHSIRMKAVMTAEDTRAKLRNHRLGRSMSEESRKKLSESARKATLRTIEEGRHVPWQSRPKGTASYPEKFWMKIFDTAGLEYKFNHAISKVNSKSCYFLDFAFVNKTGEILDFEVDGKQHKYPERVESDLSRDSYLKSLGIKVHRKDWTINKAELHSQVIEVQNLLNNFLDINIQLTKIVV